jgi:hypothetical protein
MPNGTKMQLLASATTRALSTDMIEMRQYAINPAHFQEFLRLVGTGLD